MTNNEVTFFSAVAGALVGGALAIAAGVAAAVIQVRLQRRYERERERQQAQETAARARADLIAAIRLVRYEIATNGALIRTTLEGSRSSDAQLHDATYRSVQLVLAHGLPDVLRKTLAETYGELALATAYLQQYRESGSETRFNSAERTSAIENLTEIAKHFAATNQRLLDYLHSDLDSAP